MMIFRFAVFTLVLIVSTAPNAIGQGSKPVPEAYRDAIEKIENMAAIELAKEPVGSVTVGVVSDAELVWTRSFGYADMETLEKNFGRVNSASGDLSSGYGIGFRVDRAGDFVIYGHGGSVAGYRASALFHRESKTGVIVLRNVGGRFSVSELAQEALQLVAEAKMAR